MVGTLLTVPPNSTRATIRLESPRIVPNPVRVVALVRRCAAFAFAAAKSLVMFFGRL